jgi:hypothetical protein
MKILQPQKSSILGNTLLFHGRNPMASFL